MGNVKDILTVIILASTLLLSWFSFSHFPHSSDFFLSYALLLSSVQFSHSFLSDSLRPQALHGASLSITNSQSLLKLTSIELVMPSNHLILRILLQRARPGFDPWVGKIPWKRERLPTPVFWPREFHGLGSQTVGDD